MTTPRILIIAGSDSGGGAGIQADIKTVTMLGGHAMTAITAITAQNTLGVQAVMPVPAEMVLAQIESVVSDIGVDVVKIGMIGDAATARAVAERLDPERPGHASAPSMQVVFDPVMVATSGAVLADEETIAAFELLMKRATLVTPNLPELEALTGRKIDDAEQMKEAAMDLASRLGTLVLAKGGHLLSGVIQDILVTPFRSGACAADTWSDPWIETRHSHGTGCTLASAIATLLGRGLRIGEAVTVARRYVREAMLAAPGFGAGHGPMGHGLGVAPFEVIRP
ncbi:MAG TPA: bifunctional hydroxymethylpyrimidine kinase/phosphomethylpyrimidine kinase [Allosphingosinicella sp.]|nr:bifunctional hydroxymethylpyrimidine kinase/phosphomethylpyrimidine kinase [Allosphingosinicella sp.]